MTDDNTDRSTVTWYLVQDDYIIEQSDDINDCIDARKNESYENTRITDTI